ncbi:PiggyBac transposable element-derived protein 4-like [Plakobranchus ocellatus]|uniref:PiggyBac transposable element-derived protein 4-like n=1 Tax=Plakobranchus ocellatus TaxID=259542 RepID=A0AAV3YYA6_9GAST|nr:PiggyBac transposable element-derived protein 4-like [Plakobranchus ocellatus]
MMFGIHKLPSYICYWSSDPLQRVSAIADVMGRCRYQEILRCFHVNDSTESVRKGRPGYDPLFKVRPAIETVLNACQNYFAPGVSITTDEAMIAFQGRLSFKQYMQNKPNPWGIKIWCCCDRATGYLTDFFMYTGKSDAPMQNGLGHHVVMTVGRRFLDKYHHFYFDNFFSSVRLVKDLLQRNTYSCSTVRTNRRHWPQDLKCKMDQGECKMRQVGNLVACFWRDKRYISTISIRMGIADRRTKDSLVSKKIPQPILVYNSNLAGNDLNDQLRSYYPVGRKSNKWWRCCFWYLIEVSLVNAYIIYKNTPRPPGSKPMPHFNFHLEVARSLFQEGCR